MVFTEKDKAFIKNLYLIKKLWTKRFTRVLWEGAKKVRIGQAFIEAALQYKKLSYRLETGRQQCISL